mgnify:CR=1 FL=1
MKIAKIIGWILSVLLVLMLCFSAYFKLAQPGDLAAQFAEMGWEADVMFKVGIVELVIALLFLVPRASFLATVLITGYLGGAVATHVRAMESNFFIPAVIGVAFWIALGLRDSRVFQVAFKPNSAKTNQT